MVSFIALLLLLFFSLILLGLACFVLVALIYFIPRGAPYTATDNATLQVLLAEAKLKHSEKAIDVGSGDGKVVIALAKQRVLVHGIEFNPLLVYWSRWRIRKLGLQKYATIHWGDMWRHDLSPYDVIIIYGIPYIMRKMERKLIREAKPSARILTNDFALPTWKPIRKKGSVCIYRKGKNRQ